jgi:hypothetical protein
MKFIYLISLSMIVFTTELCAEKPTVVKFEKATRMPFGLYGMAYTSDSIRIYIFGGTRAMHSYTNTVLFYDTRIDQWLDLTIENQFEGFRYGRAAYADSYKSAFLVGGASDATGHITKIQNVRYYDVISYKMESLGNNLLQSKSPGLSIWKKKLYFFGGSTEYDASNNTYTYTDKFYSYDLSTGNIEILPAMPESKETAGGIVDGMLYVFGGYNNQPNCSIHCFNLKTKKWSKKGQFSGSISSYALAQYKQYFILVGDYADMNKLIVYNTIDNSRKEFRMNFKVRHAAATVINETLHVIGGLSGDPSSPPLSTHWVLPIQELVQIDSK